MKKPMSTFKIETEKAEKYSFVTGRYGRQLYAENGRVKTYANQTQALNKSRLLASLGIVTGISPDWPYTLIKGSDDYMPQHLEYNEPAGD